MKYCWLIEKWFAQIVFEKVFLHSINISCVSSISPVRKFPLIIEKYSMTQGWSSTVANLTQFSLSLSLFRLLPVAFDPLRSDITFGLVVTTFLIWLLHLVGCTILIQSKRNFKVPIVVFLFVILFSFQCQFKRCVKLFHAYFLFYSNKIQHCVRIFIIITIYKIHIKVKISAGNKERL